MSDNAACFTLATLKMPMQGQSIDLKSILAYYLMSNRRAERLLGTLKHCVARLEHGDIDGLETKLCRAVYGYLRRPMASGVSQY